MDLKSTYNKIAKDWMRDHRADAWWVDGTDKYLSFLKPNASILDVGCGGGEKSKYFAGRGFDVIGIDFSEEMIHIAKEHVPVCQFFVKDIRHQLNLGRVFDGVFAQAVLLHIPKKEFLTVLKNITAPLTSDGYFYLAVKEKKPTGPDEAVVKENDYGYDYERFFSYFTVAEIKDALAHIGLEIVYENTSISSSKTNWIQIIAKKVNLKSR